MNKLKLILGLFGGFVLGLAIYWGYRSGPSDTPKKNTTVSPHPEFQGMTGADLTCELHEKGETYFMKLCDQISKSKKQEIKVILRNELNLNLATYPYMACVAASLLCDPTEKNIDLDDFNLSAAAYNMWLSTDEAKASFYGWRPDFLIIQRLSQHKGYLAAALEHLEHFPVEDSKAELQILRAGLSKQSSDFDFLLSQTGRENLPLRAQQGSNAKQEMIDLGSRKELTDSQRKEFIKRSWRRIDVWRDWDYIKNGEKFIEPDVTAELIIKRVVERDLKLTPELSHLILCKGGWKQIISIIPRYNADEKMLIIRWLVESGGFSSDISENRNALDSLKATSNTELVTLLETAAKDGASRNKYWNEKVGEK